MVKRKLRQLGMASDESLSAAATRLHWRAGFLNPYRETLSSLSFVWSFYIETGYRTRDISYALLMKPERTPALTAATDQITHQYVTCLMSNRYGVAVWELCLCRVPYRYNTCYLLWQVLWYLTLKLDHWVPGTCEKRPPLWRVHYCDLSCPCGTSKGHHWSVSFRKDYYTLKRKTVQCISMRV